MERTWASSWQAVWKTKESIREREGIIIAYFDCTILDFLWNLGIEHSLWFTLYSEVRMMSCIALNAYAPALLRHAEDKGPAILGVEVCVCQYKKALILIKLNVAFQIFKNLPCMKLLNFCIAPHSRCYDPQSFQITEAAMKFLALLLFHLFCFTFLRLLVVMWSFNSQYRNTSEEYLDDRFHIVDKHLLKVSLVLSKCLINIVVPHFQ